MWLYLRMAQCDFLITKHVRSTLTPPSDSKLTDWTSYNCRIHTLLISCFRSVKTNLLEKKCHCPEIAWMLTADTFRWHYSFLGNMGRLVILHLLQEALLAVFKFCFMLAESNSKSKIVCNREISNVNEYVNVCVWWKSMECLNAG